MSAAGTAITPDAVSASSESAEPRGNFGRYPLVSLALAMSVGIVVDRSFNLDPRGIVAVSAIAFAVFLAAIRARWTGVSAAAVLVLCAAGAAFHHHLAWWSVPANDVGRHLQQGSVLMKIRGRVAERPAFFPARDDSRRSAIPQTDVTRFAINCEAIVTPDGTIPVSGSLRAAVSGLLPGLTQGDTVTVLGEASGLPGPGNPGEFDVADSLKRQGLRGTIRINDRELVEVETASLNPVSVATGWLRGRCVAAARPRWNAA